MTEQWQELKETITEMRDNDGTGTQQDVCKFLANYMETLEKQMQEPCEDCIRRQAVIILIDEASEMHPYKVVGDSDTYSNYNQGWSDACDWLYANIEGVPSVKPKYTDEEIDKAQAVEQAYVDKMVELAVEEIKERYSDAIGKMKKAIDEMTEIHSDGEFYIKNVDAKWIIRKYLCGAEMSGGGEDGKDSACS